MSKAMGVPRMKLKPAIIAKEIIIDEHIWKTTFEIGKSEVFFRDYTLDGNDPVAVYSISHAAFEAAIKIWQGKEADNVLQ